MTGTKKRCPALVGCVLALAATAASAQLPPDEIGQVTLDEPSAHPHRTYVNDTGFVDAMNSRVRVIDPDKQELLGTISTGYLAPITLSHDANTLFTADTYFARAIRGKRTDLVTAWNTQTLEPRWEVEIPTKRANMMPHRYGIGVSDDDRFVYVYNFTPATSVTVVDADSQKVTTEVDIAGCFYNFPVGNRSFASICGDGSLQRISLDDEGKETSRDRKRFFSPNVVAMTERPVRNGDKYYFVDFEGTIHPLDVSSDEVTVEKTWSLFDAKNDKNWGVGGWQLMAVSPALNRLYVLVHADHEDRDWEDPSDTVWAYDLDSHEKVAEIKLPSPVWSLRVTNDDNPLLMGGSFEGDVHVYDLKKSELVGTMKDITNSPVMLLSHR